MGIDQWEWKEMGILIVFPHTYTWHPSSRTKGVSVRNILRLKYRKGFEGIRSRSEAVHVSSFLWWLQAAVNVGSSLLKIFIHQNENIR